MELPAGRYDRVLDAGLERALAAGLIGHLEDIDAADVPHRLAAHVAQAIRARLSDISAEEQAVLVGDLLGILGTPDRLLAGEKPQRLVAVSPRAGMDPPVAPDDAARRRPAHPRRRHPTHRHVAGVAPA